MKNIRERSHFSQVAGLQLTMLQKMKSFKGLFPGFAVHFRSTYFKEHP